MGRTMWYFEEAIGKPIGRTEILRISKMQPSNAGKYHCVGRNVNQNYFIATTTVDIGGN